MSGTTIEAAAKSPASGEGVFERRFTAVVAALVCHTTFVVAVGAMFVGLWNGMGVGVGPFHGSSAWIANALLLLQFPLFHSLALSSRGRAFMARLVPRGHGRTLAPTTFAAFAALQALVTFGLWSPSGVELWRPEGAWYWAWVVPYAGAWIFLLMALRDGGIGLQSGAIGWQALWAGRAPRFGGMPTSGTFAICRQPIYLGFALTLWTGPVWTADHLFIALVWTAYCAIGPILKERRFRARYGAAFEDYRASTPYFLPKIF
jgi:methanethiol S-methyltransferase